MAKKSKHKKKHQQTQKVVQKAPPVVMNTIQSAALPQQSAPAQKPSGLEVGELYIRQDILRIVILLAVV
ncbi:MAG TPA: hypothetical protein VLA04_03360, partial [Verrucomicrobiae bacterium]|nr:hypothetical protein [Verrucomicrobiae bacterium]